VYSLLDDDGDDDDQLSIINERMLPLSRSNNSRIRRAALDRMRDENESRKMWAPNQILHTFFLRECRLIYTDNGLGLIQRADTLGTPYWYGCPLTVEVRATQVPVLPPAGQTSKQKENWTTTNFAAENRERNEEQRERRLSCCFWCFFLLLDAAIAGVRTTSTRTPDSVSFSQFYY
jgi:hypothetical protein